MAFAAQPTTDALWFLDTRATPRVTNQADTGVSVIEMLVPRGAMPPLHVHDEDEMFYVLEGRVTFYAGEKAVELEAGEVFHAPKGIPHAYRVSESGARWLVLTSPGRFENFVRAVSRPADGPGIPPPLDGDADDEALTAFTATAAENGIEILGPPGMLPTDLDGSRLTGLDRSSAAGV